MNTVGYSRQQYYKAKKDASTKQQQQATVKTLVMQQRKLLPRIGTRKIHHLIKDQLELKEIKMGRDKLFDYLRQYGLLIQPKRRYIQTTNSKHWMRKYPNLIKEMKPTGAEQIFVSDITLLKTEKGNCYLNMITDAYSRKIMGYAVNDNMEARSMVTALQMAIEQRTYPDNKLIHHTDRGVQYCSQEYVQLETKNAISISMTENGDPYENALAERMNRTIKEEFCLDHSLKNITQLKEAIKQAVYLYNNYRPHLSLKMKTPQQVHTNQNPTEKKSSKPLKGLEDFFSSHLL
jgi:transposase InsO family protein